MPKKSNDLNSVESVQSKINSAGLINSTLERLWMESYTAMATGDFSKWNTKLDSIWAILGGDQKAGDDEDKKIKKMDLEIYQTGNLSSPKSKGFSVVKNTNRPLQYLLLKEKSLYLRRLQNKQGKGTAYASDDEDDVD